MFPSDPEYPQTRGIKQVRPLWTSLPIRDASHMQASSATERIASRILPSMGHGWWAHSVMAPPYP